MEKYCDDNNNDDDNGVTYLFITSTRIYPTVWVNELL